MPLEIRVQVSVIVVLVALAGLFGRVWVPWARRPRGTLVRRERLSLLGRLRMHAGPALIVLALAVGGWAVGWVPVEAVRLAAAAIAVLLALPTRYTLTTEGIAVGRTPFRRWMEFGGVARRQGGVRLQGVTGARGMTVWLSGSRDDDEFVLLLRQLVRGSYKGSVGLTFAAEPSSEGNEETRPGPLDRARVANG